LKDYDFSKTMAQHITDGNWREIERFFNQSELTRHLGINVDLQDPDRPRCDVKTVQSFHLGGIGQDYINGAVISAMYDLAIGLTALPYASEGNFATTNVNIRLLKPVENGRFYMVSRINQRIGNRVFAEATLYNFEDEARGHANGEISVGLKR
jgi:acyl-coenzyme A thioesterase PaaI-like protein